MLCYLGYVYFSHGRQTLLLAILDVNFTVPSETMFTQLKWMTFPARAVYHKAIQMQNTAHEEYRKLKGG